MQLTFAFLFFIDYDGGVGLLGKSQFSKGSDS